MASAKFEAEKFSGDSDEAGDSSNSETGEFSDAYSDEDSDDDEYSDEDSDDDLEPLTPEILEYIERMEVMKESQHQSLLTIETVEGEIDAVGDETEIGYSSRIASLYKKLGDALKMCRRIIHITEIARLMRVPVPYFEGREQAEYDLTGDNGRFLAELFSFEHLQVNCTDELDVVLYGVKCNPNFHELPIFILPKSAYDILRRYGENKFRYLIRDLITGTECRPRKIMDHSLMVVSGLDNTMVDPQDSENSSLLRFNALWEAYYRCNNSLLVFCTGRRSTTLYKKLRESRPLLTPDITVMSLGSEIIYGNSVEPDNGWVEVLNHNWDRGLVCDETSKLEGFTLKSEEEQRPHKVSFVVQEDTAKDIAKSLVARLQELGVNVKIIYSGGMELDIVPQRAGNVQALAYLCNKLRTEGKLPNHTLVCGHSGDDADLFTIRDVYGVMVSNAEVELLRTLEEQNKRIIRAWDRGAASIMEAIRRFDLGPSISPRDVKDLSTVLNNIDPTTEVVRLYLAYERWRLAQVAKSVLFFSDMKKMESGVCVHPCGALIKLHDCVGSNICYGDKEGQHFYVWVDKVETLSTGPHKCVVTFTKIEQSGEERLCCDHCSVEFESKMMVEDRAGMNNGADL